MDYIHFAAYHSAVATRKNNPLLPGEREGVPIEEQSQQIRQLRILCSAYGPQIEKAASEGLFYLKTKERIVEGGIFWNLLTSLGYHVEENFHGSSVINWEELAFVDLLASSSTTTPVSFPTADDLSKKVDSVLKKRRLDDEAKGKLAWDAFQKQYGPKLREAALNLEKTYEIRGRPAQWHYIAGRLRDLQFKVYLDDEDDKYEFMRIEW